MITEHTPGPWIAEGAKVLWEAPHSRNRWVVADLADASDGRLSPEIESNARLIAAAPDLLDALKSTRACVAGINPIGRANTIRQAQALEFINQAIARAEGQ
jgi:hypothetical protein